MKFPSFLRVAIVTSLGIFETNMTEKRFVQITGGLESQLLDVLAEGLKFKYTPVIPEDKEWGRKTEDGNWTGIIAMVAKNEADIGISKLGIFYDRLSVVDFSYTYSIEDVTFATKLPGTLSREIAVFLPFSIPLWITLSVTMILVAISLKLFLKQNYRFQDTVMYVIGSLLVSPQKIKFESVHEKVLIISWLGSSMFITYSYTSVLLSFLSVPLRERPITDKYSLLNVLERNVYTVQTQEGSSIVSTMLNSKDETTSSIANYIIKNRWFIRTTKEEITDALEKPKTAVIMPRNNFRFNEGKIYLSQDSFFSLYWGIALNKRFCCKQELDTIIHRITAAGLYQKLQNDFFFKAQIKDTRKSIKESKVIKPLAIRDLVGAFLFLFSGCILGSLLLISEICSHKKRKSKAKN